MSEVRTHTVTGRSISGKRLGHGLPMLVSERRLLLVALDLLALDWALLLSLALRPRYSLSGKLILQHPSWFLLLNLLWLGLAHAFDLYNLRTAGRLPAAASAVLKAGVPTAVIYLLIPFVTPALPSSRLELIAFPVLLIGLLLATRGFFALVLAQSFSHRRALIVGAGWAGCSIAEALVEHGDGTYDVVGFVDDDPAKQGGQISVSDSTFYILGDRHAIPRLISRHGVTTLVMAITHEVNGQLLQVMMECLELGVEVIPLPVLYEQMTGRVPIEHVGDNWYVAMPLRHPGTGAVWPMIKRLMDILLSSLGLLCLGLAFPFIALAIHLDSPGPIFYTQKRVGRGGREFTLYKFRSMVTDAEKEGAVWAEESDPRVTRVGRFLRKTHVDEFPQFLNILKGDMSAVGPRPERPEFIEELAREIPFYRVRHAVKPGMAGWGLVRQGYGSSKEDALIKLQHDLYYIKHQGLWLDLVILLKTVLDTVTLRGRA